MRQPAYRDRDYAFGQTMLTLRMAMGFTQPDLAEYLGVSRFAVGAWEAGNTYPKSDRLQALITLAVQCRAFPSGGEADAIRELWKAAHQKVLLDEAWLVQLLSSQPQPHHAAPATGARYHWQDALAVDHFYGREGEMNLVSEWIIQEQCQVVTLLGFGGIGKSALAVQVMHQVANEFEVVIWRSLRDLPTCNELLTSLLQTLAPQALGETSERFEQRLHQFMEQLRASHVLVVLDNVDSVLEEDEITGRMRPGYEDFGRFLAQVATTRHQSTILLTSRQKPDILLPYEGTHARVRTLRLAALDAAACEQLLVEKQVTGSSSERQRLIQSYAGNPLALKIVAQTIVDLFEGEVTPFLEQEGFILGGVRELMHEQYQRLTPLEKRIAVWLAIMREPVTLNQLQSLLVTPLPPATALDMLNRLYRHSLIERGQAPGTFTLQSVVLEYLTEQIVAESCDEFLRGELALLIQHGLEQAQVKDYVRQTQTRLLIAPLCLRLQHLGQVAIERQIFTLFDKLRAGPLSAQGYGPANLIALWREVHGHLRTLDLSQLLLRGAYLQAVEMQDCNLAQAMLQDTVFTESFSPLQSLSISGSGEHWATGDVDYEIRVYEAEGRVIHRHWQRPTVTRIALSHDGRSLAGGAQDGEIHCWDVASAELKWSTERGMGLGPITQLAFSADGRLLAIASDLGLWLRDLAQGSLLATLPHPAPVPGIAWNRDGTLLASGDAVGTVRFWAIHADASAELARRVQAHSGVVTAVAFSPAGDRLASGSWDGTVKVWNVADGSLDETLVQHQNAVQRVTWSADGRLIAYSVRSEASWLWDVEAHCQRAALRGHTGFMRGLLFTPDSRELVSASEDGSMRVWDAATGACIRVIHGYSALVQDLSWGPDGAHLAVSMGDPIITIHALNDALPTMTIPGHIPMPSITWSPDGRFIAVRGSQDLIELWDAKTGAALESLFYPDDPRTQFTILAWSPDSKCLAAGTSTHGVQLFDMTTRTVHPLVEGQIHGAHVGDMRWSPNGVMLAVACEDDTVGVWDVTSGDPLLRVPGERWCLAWSGDSTQLAVVESHSDGCEVVLWNITRRERTPLCLLSSGVHYLAWIKVSNMLVTTESDGCLRWWDMQSGECMRQVDQGTIMLMKLSPDDTRIATSDVDGIVWIYDAQSGEVLKTLRRDRPYERMNITGLRGVTEAQKATLLALGAIEKSVV